MKKVTCGEVIPQILQNYGVDTVFGIPGVHSIELYRGLPETNIRHITPRHEQGAGFMADGYARACGKPGVCFIITGPGMTNIATAMGQAMQDSIPMLVISSVNSTKDLGMGEGRLHELPDQLAITREVSVFSHRLTDVQNLPRVLARAFSVFQSQRPGPVHIEIPLDVLVQDASEISISTWPSAWPPAANGLAVKLACETLKSALRPLMIVGGGARKASSPLKILAEKLDMPVINTNNGKGVIPASHPLSVGGSPSCECIREEIEKNADVILAFGTEFAETDYDFFFLGDLQISGKLIRVDIDANQLSRVVKPDIPILADCQETAWGLVKALEAMPNTDSGGEARAEQMRSQLVNQRNPDYQAFFDAIKEIAPDSIIVGDSAQPNYHAQVYYDTEQPGRYFHSATGYGTLGYAIPAAQGARLACPDTDVISLFGDGGGQFTLNELSSAVEANLSVIFVVWNNRGYGEIKRFMNEMEAPQIGVDIHTPDYPALAKAMGCEAYSANSLEEFKQCLTEAKQNSGPSLIDVSEPGLVTGAPFGGQQHI